MSALEKRLGMGNGTIGKWGKNGRMPNYANLCAVADALGVTVSELTSEQKESPALTSEASPAKQELLNMIDAMSAEQLSRLLPIIREAQKLL